jgi:Uma2 family endonuclease
MFTTLALLTAKEYSRLPDPGYPTELVRGEVIEMNMPVPRHGQICSRIDRLIGAFADQHRLGHVLTNDAGILTQRDPDTVRGGDVWFVSFDKVPPGPLPNEYLEVAPDIVFEVLSPTARRARVLRKVAEYLELGVPVVCVVDPDSETVVLHFADEPEITLRGQDVLTFPQMLPGFSVPVQSLFT